MNDWQGRAKREAAAILAGALPNTGVIDYEQAITLVAMGWLQGANFGSHEALGLLEEDFDAMRAEL